MISETHFFVKLEIVGSFYQFMYHCSLFFKYRAAGAVDIKVQMRRAHKKQQRCSVSVPCAQKGSAVSDQQGCCGVSDKIFEMFDLSLASGYCDIISPFIVMRTYACYEILHLAPVSYFQRCIQAQMLYIILLFCQRRHMVIFLMS